jgi:hypothetical protein
MAVLAGIDFFTAEVLTWRGPATYYLLFVIQLETRRVTLAGITQHPTEEWLHQVARNLTDADTGALRGQRYLLHDRDTKFRDRFGSILRAGGVKPVRLPATSPNLNAFSERWVRSVNVRMSVEAGPVREEIAATSFDGVRCAFPEGAESSGEGNVLLFPDRLTVTASAFALKCRKRLGGLLRYYSCAA